MLSARLLAAAAGDADAAAGVLSGEHVLLTAWQEKAGHAGRARHAGWRARFIPMAAGADGFLLPVREGGRLALHLQAAAGADVTLEKAMDGGNIGTLRPDLGAHAGRRRHRRRAGERSMKRRW
jgi:hypothetical protein